MATKRNITEATLLSKSVSRDAERPPAQAQSTGGGLHRPSGQAPAHICFCLFSNPDPSPLWPQCLSGLSKDVSLFFFRFLQTSSSPFQIFADPFCSLLLSPIDLKIYIWRKETSILYFSTNVIKLEIKDAGENWLKLWDSLAHPVIGISSTHPTAGSPRLTLIPNNPALSSRKLMLFVYLSHHSVTNLFHELGFVT